MLKILIPNKKEKIDIFRDGEISKTFANPKEVLSGGGSYVEVTGTINTNTHQGNIVAGGKTIILTLSATTWVTAGATFDAQRQNIINGLDSNKSEATGWDAVVKAGLAVTSVVRTSNSVVTITLPAFATYNITEQEYITFTCPATATVDAVENTDGFPIYTGSRRLPDSYDEATYDSAGGKDYSSLATWEDATDTDLVNATKGKVLTCYSGIHNDTVTLSGATTSSSYFRVIRAVSGSRGTPTSGVRFEKATTATTYMFWLSENNAQIHDIASKLTSSTNSVTNINFLCYESGYSATFVGCTSYGSTSTGTSGQSHGFVVGYYNGSKYNLINCVALNHNGTTTGSGFYIRNYSGGTVTAYMYNCTSVGNSHYGVWGNTTTGTINIYLKNTIAQGNSSSNILMGGAGTENLYETTNATSGVTFDTDGYHLKSGVIGTAVAQGTDLSTDATFAFNDDIDGTTITRAWAIGCDWYAPTQGDNDGPSSRRTPLYYYESTYGTGKNYTALSTWESDTDINLTTPTVGFVLTCDAGAWNDGVTVAGATTSSSYFRVIRATSANRGTKTSGARFERSGVTDVIVSSENYFGLYDVGVSNAHTATYRAVSISAATYNKIVGCTIYDLDGSSTTFGQAVALSIASSSNYTVVANCFIDNVDKGSGIIADGILIDSSSNVVVYNCTIKNCESYGAWTNTNATIKNSAVVSNATNIYAGSGAWTQVTNATSGVTFEADGYHLASTDTGAIDDGTDLSADGTFAFTDDIDGDTRSGSWDIGADEYVSASNDFVIADAVSASSAENIALTQAGGTFAIADCSSTSIAENIVLVFNGGTFEIANAESASSAENITLESQNEFVIADAESASSAENITLIFNGTFTIANAESGSSVENIELTQAGGEFIIANAVSASSIENIDLIFQGEFEIASAVSDSSIEEIVLELASGLFEIADSVSSSSAENITLEMEGEFVIDNAVSESSSENITLELASGEFAIDDAVSSSSAENITLIFQGTFAIDNAESSSSIENIVLELNSGVLEIANAESSSSIENITLEFNGGEFELASAESASSIENITLDETGLFQIDSAVSSSSTEEIVLVLNSGVFEIDNAISSPTAENIELIYNGGTFEIQDCNSPPTIENITLEFAGGEFEIADSVSTSTIENISLTRQSNFTDDQLGEIISLIVAIHEGLK